MDDCVFCKIIGGEVPANMVYENDKVFAFLDIKPVNKGHTLVVPKEHYSYFTETPEDVLCEMISRSKKIAEAVVKAVNADGFNIGINTKPAAGQVIFHTHLHIIPRFKGDGLRPWQNKDTTSEDLKKVQDLIKQNLQ